MGSDSQEKVERKRSLAMSIIQCVGFVTFMFVVLNIAVFKGRLGKKVRKELKADIKALRGVSGGLADELERIEEWVLKDEESKHKVRPPPKYAPKFNHKKKLNHDLYDELFMEQELMEKGMAPMDEFHKANHVYLEKLNHHADLGH